MLGRLVFGLNKIFYFSYFKSMKMLPRRETDILQALHMSIKAKLSEGAFRFDYGGEICQCKSTVNDNSSVMREQVVTLC